MLIPGIHAEIFIKRLAHGFPHIRAHTLLDQYYGLGYMHGLDRAMHMHLLRLIGRGQASEKLIASDELVAIDRYMRWIGLFRTADAEVALLAPQTLAILEAYCQGVNTAVHNHRTPLEFRLAGYQPGDWTPADVLLIAKMMGFVGLTQAQGDSEKLIVQLLQNGLDTARLKELFPAITEEIDADTVQILRQVKLENLVVPADVQWHSLLPSLTASNNWAISPARSASGQAILCGDPHLALQMPSIWYRVVLVTNDGYIMGATPPGVPAIPLGRTHHLAWATTYGTMDSVDYFVEEVRNGRYRRGSAWLPLQVREEIITPKKKASITLRVYETEHGLLEGDPAQSGDGYYLAYAWASRQQEGTGAASLDSFFRIHQAQTVPEALEGFAGLTFAAFNWVAADRTGNIGYQLGGLYPQRANGRSGLLPHLGWEETHDWQGYADPHDHPRTLNPADGLVVTANQDLNDLGRVRPMTLPMSGYRAARIRQLLQAQEKLGVADMQRIHYDRYSLQAEAFMALLRPLLPDTENGNLMRQWDLRYDANSLGATLFERVYAELLLLVFGELGVGRPVMEHVMQQTGQFAMLHGHFDRVLLQECSAWFGSQSREALLRLAIERGLAETAVPHAQARRITINNLFFGGQLPAWLGYDVVLDHIGSRATIPQSQIYQMAGRPTSFAATLRLICDMATDEMHTNLCGGASDRRFSPYYASGIQAWENGVYDVLRP